jgi:hypothetical protein
MREQLGTAASADSPRQHVWRNMYSSQHDSRKKCPCTTRANRVHSGILGLASLVKALAPVCVEEHMWSLLTAAPSPSFNRHTVATGNSYGVILQIIDGAGIPASSVRPFLHQSDPVSSTQSTMPTVKLVFMQHMAIALSLTCTPRSTSLLQLLLSRWSHGRGW